MNPAKQIYDQLWDEAMSAFERGEPRVDSHLLDKTKDQRRGVSLAIGLPVNVQANIKNFLDQIAPIVPEQYFYQPEELHVTVLTFISATEFWRKEIGDIFTFRGILREILSHHQPFKVELRGVTAAPNAVMIQGFPIGDELENIREEIRRTFAQRGFAGRLDRRYPNRAAHVTTVRFRKPDADWKRLADLLKEHRPTNFGEIQVETLQLVWGDWYSSADTRRIIEEYHLKNSAHSPSP